jgi:hypothetical protein
MCDYSLDLVASRPAKVGDKLVTTKFQNSMTRGFAAIGEPNVAVCLLPGTEVAFEKEVQYERFFVLFPSMKHRNLGKKVAQFRQINVGRPMVHHDALEFPDGESVLLTRLCEGQHATVLQLPASPRPVNAAEGQKRDSLVR